MDYPYIILYIILLFLVYKYIRTKKQEYANISLLIAFVFIAFRAPVVGADTWDYIRFLTGERNFYNADEREMEILSRGYREIICSITSSRTLVMLINSIITLSPLYFLFKKYSHNIPLSVVTFFLFEIYIVYFVALRQMIGNAVLLFGFMYYLDEQHKRRWKWLVLLGCSYIGFLFHTSIVIYGFIFVVSIFLPIYNRKTYLLAIVFSMLIGIVLKSFSVTDFFAMYLNMGIGATDRIDNYLESYQEGDSELIMLATRLSIIGLFCFSYLNEKYLKHPFSRILLIAIIIYNLFYSVPMIHRLVMPLALFACILTTQSNITVADSVKRRRTYICLLILLLLYFFRSQFIQCAEWDPYNSGRLHPYYWFFEDYSNHPSIKYFN